MDQKRLNEVTQNFSNKSILVIGDLMLDTYMWGDSERISPEAPVPIVRVTSVENNPGGAANVALNLVSLGAKASLLGLVGDDAEGIVLRDLLKEKGISDAGIIKDRDRPTTVKARIIAHGQQIVRTDREVTWSLGEDAEKQVAAKLDHSLEEVDAVILQDYNKGMFGPDSIRLILDKVGKLQIPVFVDPKQANFFEYKNVRLFKPNIREFEAALSADYTADEFEIQGLQLRDSLNFEIVMVTRGEQGISLFTEDGLENISTQARNVHDVSGAGDTVIASFTLANLAGGTAVEAATLANYAAGRVCEEVGVVPITLEMLSEIFRYHNSV